LKIAVPDKAKCLRALCLKLSFAFGVCAAFSAASPVSAQTKPANSWVRAQVITDGAAVYSKPDFDSPVQDYLSYQTQVIVSKRPYAGVGGLGLFHRIHYGNKNGFITDTDIRVVRGKDSEKASEDKEKDKEKDKDKERDKKKSKAFEKEDDEGKPPLYLTRYLGGTFALVKFTEKFEGHRLSDNMGMYGMRMMGPGTLFDGPPLDFNLWFSLKKPGYLSQFATGTPTGFMLFGDVMAMLPLVDLDKTLVSYGVGLMWVYTRYSIPVKNATNQQVGTFDSQEVRIGVDFDLGFGYKFGRWMARADAKYYIEKTTYPGYMLTVMTEY
jgi:hypothetical protein